MGRAWKSALPACLAAAGFVALAGGPWWLTWEYDELMPASNVVFEVWTSTNLHPASGGFPFSHWTNVEAPPVAFEPSKAQEFFIVRASNRLTGEVSDWNEKTR